MHETSPLGIPTSMSGSRGSDSNGRLRLARSDDEFVSNVFGSSEGPTHPPVKFPSERPSWLEQQRLALANLPKVGL